MRSHSARLTRLLRLVVIALLFLTTSGLSAAMAADDDGNCIGCGCDCTGSCDGRTCPPGPLCSDAPQCVSIAAVTPLVDITVACSMPPFAIDTRLPASAFSDGLFDPPRSVG